MSDNSSLRIVSHFHEAEWPVVNKLRAIATCSNITYNHYASKELLDAALSQAASWEKILLVTDEQLIGLVANIEKAHPDLNIETLLFLEGNIPDAAKKISHLKTIKHIMGSKNYHMIGKDLSILVKKIKSRDLLDLSKYLSYGAFICSRAIKDQKSKIQVISEIYNYISSLGCSGYDHPFEEYARRMTEIADELVINAIFSANSKLKNADRSENFQLGENQKIQVCWGFDGDYFGLSVTDPFGDLSRETILQYLDSNRKLGGVATLVSGGLGIKMVFERTHQLVVNVLSGHLTEVICVTKFENRLRNLKDTKQSIFYFDKEDV